MSNLLEKPSLLFYLFYVHHFDFRLEKRLLKKTCRFLFTGKIQHSLNLLGSPASSTCLAYFFLFQERSVIDKEKLNWLENTFDF